jgi:CheY-like chemotaxis protein
MGRVALVADHDIGFCGALAPRLAAEGHECVVVNGGCRAFEAVKKARPDVVLLDVPISEVSAFRLCRMIRKDSLLYTVPVMILSDTDDESELSHWLELGADDCLVRPIVLNKLIEKLRDLLSLGEATRKRDPLTGMLGMDGVRRAIDHSLACGKGIAACYLSVADLRALARTDGFRRVEMDGLVKAVADLIRRVAGESSINELVAAHVGTGYFVAVVYPDEYEKFCARLIRRFDSELGHARAPKGAIPDAFRPSGARPALKLSIGVVHNLHREYRCADEVFRALANVHHEAEKSPTSAFFVCRRCQGH